MVINPIVSICIPAYKQPNSLLRAVRSALAQEGYDFEVVITDDSPDNAVEIALVSIITDPRVVYFRNKSRLGAVANWNESVKRAKGRIIKILHHDDWFCDEHSLAKVVEPILQGKAAVVFSACRDMSITGVVLREHCISHEMAEEWFEKPWKIALGNFIGDPSVLTYDRQKIALDFDVRYTWLADTEYYIRIVCEAKGFCWYCDCPVVNVTNDSPLQLSRVCENSYFSNFCENLMLFCSAPVRGAIDRKNLRLHFKGLAIPLTWRESFKSMFRAIESGALNIFIAIVVADALKARHLCRMFYLKIKSLFCGGI